MYDKLIEELKRIEWVASVNYRNGNSIDEALNLLDKEINKFLSELEKIVHTSNKGGQLISTIIKVVEYEKSKLPWLKGAYIVDKFEDLQKVEMSDNSRKNEEKKLLFLDDVFYQASILLEEIFEPIFNMGIDFIENFHESEVAKHLAINYVFILNPRLGLIKEFKSVTNNKTKSNQSLYERDNASNFDSLFIDPSLIEPSLEILRNLATPVIDAENNYIGNLKGVICVWIEELQRQGIVQRISDREILAKLIEMKIKRFSINGSMFAKDHKRATSNYRLEIKTKISRIKLSQDSQK